MNKLIIVTLWFLLSPLANAQDITGFWTGKASLGKEKSITFEFKITKTKQGDYKTIVSIPSARVKGLSPKKTSFNGTALVVDGSNLGISYEGTYDKDKNRFIGTFKEGFNAISLTLEKGEAEIKQATLIRPQEPVKPLPYSHEEVKFKNTKAHVELAGTFTKPHGTNKFPVVLLISGSGPSDRDQTFANHKTFLVLSDYLTRKGIAVLRYDDRGSGASTGDFSNATTLDFAKDAMSAIKYLKTRNDIDPDAIGIIGHSEGGIIAPIVANKMTKDIAFIISLAGTAIPGSELSLIQSKTLRPFPVPDEAQYESAIRKAIVIASKKGPRKKVQRQLLEHYNKEILPILIDVTGSKERAKEIIGRFVNGRTTPWSRYFYRYNPADEYRKVRCDVLALYGTKDTQVLANINAPALEKALKNGKSQHYSVNVLENLNHLFQESKTGEMSEYESIDQTISPIVLHKISSWIFERINLKENLKEIQGDI